MNKSATILFPCFNDWASLTLLIPKIIKYTTRDLKLKILIVDDGSTVERPSEFLDAFHDFKENIKIIRLSRNLGHQRAIAIGLAYLNDEVPCHGDIIVMDADGEDRPEDILKLVFAAHDKLGLSIVFAERKRRSEGLLFKFGYFGYKLFHYILTGKKIKFGNFSLIPEIQLKKVVTISELWNHYAAAVVIARFPLILVPTNRAKRISGHSQMNYSSLILHGLKAISVYSENIGIRALIISFLLSAISLFFLSISLLMPNNTLINGFKENLVIICSLILIISIILLTVVLFFTLFILHGRSSMNFIPERDYKYFVYNEKK
jgi:glycosyltransferase involved in cell wall biosynthesis